MDRPFLTWISGTVTWWLLTGTTHSDLVNLASSIRAQTGKECFNVIAGLGGQEVTYNDIAGFVRDRRIGEEFWFGVDA